MERRNELIKQLEFEINEWQTSKEYHYDDIIDDEVMSPTSMISCGDEIIKLAQELCDCKKILTHADGKKYSISELLNDNVTSQTGL